ncbi:MAG: SPFH domain-containing protein [Candidatus Iainarchaeum sp.]|jgi:regulator of protease activity HflC (stomatin/prohibitin superfamily)|nr:MAG: FtsH protease regulator HflK [archaeon ADurb.Bin336]
MNLFSKIWLIFLSLFALVTIISLFSFFPLFIVLFIVFIFLFTNSVVIIYEYERGIVFSFGKYDGLLQPGLNVVLPIVQRVSKVDLRVVVTDVPKQDIMTKDNVSVSVDAVIYYKIRENEAEKSIIEVDNYVYAISQLAQTAMRNVVGEMKLDEVLSNRDEASGKIREIVDIASDPWGIKVDSVELKHIEVPESMKTIMAKAAEAERIRRAAVIKASGEAAAAKLVSKAAKIIGEVDGGLNLRTLQELDNISSDPANEIVFFIPLDMIKPVKGYGGKKK